MIDRSPTDETVIEKQRIILVEGPTDHAFFTALLQYLGYENDVQLIITNGKDRIRDRIRELVLRPNFSDVVALGITRDMDTFADNAFVKITDALNAAKLPVPTDVLETASAPSKPTVSILLFPDDATEGELEDLCLRAFEGEGMMTCADSYFRCLDRLDEYVADNKYPKAKLQVLLTALGEGELTLRQAVYQTWWRARWTHAAFVPVTQFTQGIATV